MVKSIVAKKLETSSTFDGPRVRFTVDASSQLLQEQTYFACGDGGRDLRGGGLCGWAGSGIHFGCASVSSAWTSGR